MKKLTLFLITLIILGSCNHTPTEQKTQQLVIPDDLPSIEAMLDSIHTQDQKFRLEIDEIVSEFGQDSKEIKNHWEKISKTDSSNLVIVKSILDKHGWLSSEQIGYTANGALFLVIQHSDQKTQENYLPLMRQAVKDGKAKSQDLALLEDRINTGNGELQVYGSQLSTDSETGKLYVLPLLEPDKVNERRAEVGLGTIQDYISSWDLEWDVEEYKKELSERMARRQERGR